MSFNIARLRGSNLLKSLTSCLLYGATLTASLGGVAYADPSDVKEILDEALPQLENTVGSVSQGCSGSHGGLAPFDWQERQKPGHLAVRSFTAARAASEEGRTDDVRQHVSTGLGQWDTFINSLSLSCAGGRRGTSPVNYSVYLKFRGMLKERLQTAVQSM